MQTAKILSKTMLTEAMLELKLMTPYFDYTPGQRVFLHYPNAELPLKRAYSIADSTIEGESMVLTFLIKLIENGKASTQLRTLKEGDEIGLEGPNGHFTLKETSNPKAFLSTGSGLSPCYAMAKNTPESVQKRFFFSVSYAKDLFYAEKIKDLNISETHISISREHLDGYEEGRIQIEHIDFPQETEFYLCGVPQMVTEYRNQLKARGYGNIYIEAY